MSRLTNLLYRRESYLLPAIGWLVFVAIGLSRAETNIEDFFPWLPDDTPARNNYIHFIEQFGADDILIVSWEGCNTQGPTSRAAGGGLADPRKSSGCETSPPHRPVIDQLTSPPQNLSRMEAIERLQNILVGPDGETTCLFVQLSAAGMRDRRLAVSRIIQQAHATLGIPSDQLRLGGHPYVGYYSAEQTRNSIIWLSIPVALVSTVLAWVCLQRWRLMIARARLRRGGGADLIGDRPLGRLSSKRAPFSTPVIGLRDYDIRGDSCRQLRPCPPSVATANWDARRRAAEHAAAVRRRAWRACLLSSSSTALGTLSLVWSDFPAIREFGAFGTIGVLLTFTIHIGLLPLLLGWLFPDNASTVHVSRFDRPFAALLERLLRRRLLILSATVAGAARADLAAFSP